MKGWVSAPAGRRRIVELKKIIRELEGGLEEYGSLVPERRTILPLEKLTLNGIMLDAH